MTVKGNAIDFFSRRDDSLQEAEMKCSTVTDIMYLTHMPNLTKASIDILYKDEDSHVVIKKIKMALSILLSAWYKGIDMNCKRKDEKKWTKLFQKIEFNITCGETVVNFNKGCLKVTSNDPELEEKVLCRCIRVCDIKEMLRAVVIPDNFSSDVIEIISSRYNVDTVYVNPTKDNSRNIAEFFEMSNILNVVLRSDVKPTEALVDISTEIVTEMIEKSDCMQIGIPVRLRNKDEVDEVTSKFYNLKSISYYAATEQDAIIINDILRSLSFIPKRIV